MTIWRDARRPTPFVFVTITTWGSPTGLPVRSTAFPFMSSMPTGSTSARSATEEKPCSKTGYRLPLPLDPGKYRLVAWAGLKEGCFEPSGMQAGVSGPEDLVVTLRCDGDGEVPCDKPLSPLWQAMQETVTVPQPGTEQTDTLRLIKDTNILRVILQRRDGAILHAADYDFSILCPHGNGRLAYDNTLLDCHPLVYRPYLQTEGTDGEGSGGAEAVSNVIAELSLSRLMENDAMRLHITDASGDVTLVDIPLVEYLLMTGREPGRQDKV